jgi:DNA invertase Pin-like site-specific DNA recombinase
LNESIDTASPTGKFTFHLFSALAEFERDLIRERTRAGLAAARARGRIGGRKKALSPAQVKTTSTLMKEGEMSIKEICRLLKISRSTLYRYVAPDGTIRKTKGS